MTGMCGSGVTGEMFIGVSYRATNLRLSNMLGYEVRLCYR